MSVILRHSGQILVQITRRSLHLAPAVDDLLRDHTGIDKRLQRMHHAGLQLKVESAELIACILFIICRPVVKQVQEKVFTSDAFQALDLHPHLVSIPP